MKIDKLLCNGRKRLFMSYHHEALLEAKGPQSLTHDARWHGCAAVSPKRTAV